jgi:hypothetical protein
MNDVLVNYPGEAIRALKADSKHNCSWMTDHKFSQNNPT